MKTQSSRHDYAVQKNARVESQVVSRLVRLVLIAALGALLAISMPDDIPHAQQSDKREAAVKVTNVTTSGNVVSISADGSLGRAQTWQDSEGFHVVLVNGQVDAGAVRGAKVRRVGNSLELVVPVRQGASVTVQPRGSRLDLVVTGGVGEALRVENFPTDSQAERVPKAVSKVEEQGEQIASPDESRAAQSAQRRRGATDLAQPAVAPPAASQPQLSATAPAVFVNPPDAQPGPQQPAVAVNPPDAQPAIAAQPASGEGFDLFSLPMLLMLLGVALAGAAVFLFRRRRKDSGEGAKAFEVEEKNGRKAKSAEDESTKPFKQIIGDRRKSSIAVPFERRTSGPGSLDEAGREQRFDANGADRRGAQSERGQEPKSSGAFVPATEFGPYRIDQEVARLIQGNAHSIEVIASRSSEDRRAVETSLLKSLRSAEADEDGRRRARTALEDYGFVARYCAGLLLGAESFERASAAHTLGEMRSAQALPFLTEALYDADPVVRMECVQSLGALGLPSAIGALLDVSRRHPELSASVLGPALTACSVESLELSIDALGESRIFADAGAEMGDDFFTGELRGLGRPSGFEELPEWVEDEALQGALEQLASAEVETRVLSAQHLAQFQVRRAVEALAAMALHDPEPAVRSAAVTSFGLIDHESVFVHVVVALADEAREVRAAAARAFSRLSFDRADAYVRVIESTDGQTLRDVAQACVKAGLAAQAISRLASEDRGQTYEAFSLLSLVAKAGVIEPILDTIECNRDIEVRLTCIRLLDLASQPQLRARLLRISENGGVPEKVRRAIVETVERAGQLQPVGLQ
ncbi:MAG: HEAT repeat domain-containing protein [Rubrivivax sp.]|nr:HEAT repeat domain-containing protein [Pyrinomonadaceae bacterium]